MVKLKDMREGSVILVRGNFGNGIAVRAVVDELDTDIKNGRPGISYTQEKSRQGNWAYLEQIDAVIKY